MILKAMFYTFALVCSLVLCIPQTREQQPNLIRSLNYTPAPLTEIIGWLGRDTGHNFGLLYEGSVYPGQPQAFHFVGGTLKELLVNVSDLRPTLRAKTLTTDASIVLEYGKAAESLYDIPVDLTTGDHVSRRTVLNLLEENAQVLAWLRVHACTAMNLHGAKSQYDSVDIVLPSRTTKLGDLLTMISEQTGRNFWYIFVIRNAEGCQVSFSA